MPTTDPAVRSIRVASTLNDRFGAILREVKSIRNVRELELRIGEAQQIYPEIWRHLDEARTTLLRRGVDVFGYDALRATERPGQQAVSDIESAHVNPIAIGWGTLEYAQFKKATFHAAGHKKAQDACSALMGAVPDVDWKKLAEDEQAELEAVGSLKPKWWRFW